MGGATRTSYYREYTLVTKYDQYRTASNLSTTIGVRYVWINSDACHIINNYTLYSSSPNGLLIDFLVKSN